jgi:hypothetical protein
MRARLKFLVGGWALAWSPGRWARASATSKALSMKPLGVVLVGGAPREDDGMEELHRGSVFTLHAQVGLYDLEDPDSYPQWDGRAAPAIIGEKGVAVATAEAIFAEVAVLSGDQDPAGILCISGTISVGHEGLEVGNVPASTLALVSWPAGNTSVRVFVNSEDPREVNSVTFVLQPE